MDRTIENRTRTRATLLVCCAAALAACVSIVGCSTGGGSNPSGPGAPTGVYLTPDKSRVQVTQSTDIQASHSFDRADPPECDWYVDGDLGGNPFKGTITQGNPATYTAPSAVPPGNDRVVITAVSRADSTLSASDTLTVAFTIKHVDAENGSDTAAGGPWAAPFKTISYATDHVSEGDTVLVMPGRYDEALGEDEYMYVPAGVTLRGSHRDSVVISTTAWGGIMGPQNGSTLEGVTIENVESNHAIYVTADDVLIRNVKTVGAYGHSAIRIIGPDNEVVVEDCEIINDVAPGTERGFEIITDTHSTVRNCTVSGWGYGIFVNTTSDPLIEGCTITENGDGVISFGGSGGQISQPDLGGGARGSGGGNVIRDNTEAGLVNGCDTQLWAQNNTWGNDPPTEGPPYPCDLANTGGGSIIWF